MISGQRLIRLCIPLAVAALGTAQAAAQSRSPLLLVVSKQESLLVIADPRAKTVLARVPTGKGPHNVAASDDGKLAFVGNSGDSSISVIDVAARKEVRRVKLGPDSRPHGITFAGGKVYFTAAGYKAVGCYDPVSEQLSWLGTGQKNTEMLAIHKDLSKIFAANTDSHNVTVFEAASDKRKRLDWNATVIPVGKAPHGIDISPDGKFVWTSHELDGGLSIIDVSAKQVSQVLSLGNKSSNRLKFTPDGRWVLVSDRGGHPPLVDDGTCCQDGALVVIDAAARNIVKRIQLGRRVTEVLVEPDGSHAYVSVAGNNDVAIVDLKKLEVTGRIPTSRDPEGLAWVER